ncbi:hypothetical protein AGLY_015358 [Aphis glycines]|uniref:Reverse transcriptase domain-containing protein n=1 Tax=Aphis glycines TaxID=307491 RepID=A0A6G0T161_APHGL|nr:hypothetical protein AGLY_015358 [Aphis glycines]
MISTKLDKKRPLSGPALMIASCNIEGINSNKEELLAELCKENSFDVLCVQETHRNEGMNNPRINGMKLVAIRPHWKYGSAIFVRSSIDVTTSQITEIDDIEILTIEVGKCTVTSIYKPPNSTFAFDKPANFDTKNIHIIIGDFNSHHTNWGYDETDNNGDNVEVLAESNRLTLIHDPKLPPLFNSGCRIKHIPGLTPDLVETLEQYTDKYEADPFDEDTIEKGEELMNLLTEVKRKRWCDLLTEVDMKRSSKKAWNLIKRLDTAGLDNMFSEQIKHFGKTTRLWLLSLFNNIRSTLKIPKIWRKAKVIALLKPGKEPDTPSSYRPEQAGFRPGKSCTGQVLNLTQYIENGFEEKKVTGVSFIHLSSAYDTVNHGLLLSKVYQITRDYKFTQIIQTLLSNRRFFVTLAGKNSRWRNIRNGLPQGSVLAPTLFNIYTNDQPISTDNNIKHYVYADDSAIAVQEDSFEAVETKLSKTLDRLGNYYRANYLKPNPSKTNVSAFHLRNKQANRKLIVKWEDVELTHCSTPTYLGVTLDRALTYKTHCEKTSKKINTRNGLIRKLTGSAWGAQPHALRVSAMALCYSVGEYACPVWRSSTHAKKIDIALNTTCRLITGCLRNTPMDKVYLLAGIPPPSVRRLISSKIERGKQKRDTRHPMYGQNDPTSRLKSRKSFLKITEELTETPLLSRLNEWKKLITDTNSKRWLEPAERLPHGNNLDWPVWKTLDRLRVGVGRTKENMRKWGYGEQDITCICGQDQTTSHLLVCPRGSKIDDIEILTIEVGKCTVTSIYKPPNSTFAFDKPANFDTKNIHIIIGDFNSHHTNWGYDETDNNGDNVEVLAESNRLTLIHDPKLPPLFNSGCRIKHIPGLTPDLVETLEQYTDKYEADPFDEDTIEKGEELMNLLTEVKRKRWCDLLTEVDMKRSSKKAWNLIKRLDTAGLDNMFSEQIKHFGKTTRLWLLSLFNNIRSTLKIPKIWRKAKVIALLKPGKEPDTPSSYRPEQAGFRPGKSCTGQVLNLTQYIENGFEEKKVTGVSFIHLSSAYDTVNHGLLLSKVYQITRDYKFTQIIQTLLSNRRFFVTLAGKNSRWRNIRNGLPQGSVLAPTLFNIYTNDQPISTDNNIKHYVYADDSAIAVQEDSFEAVETKLSKTLDRLGNYYRANYLKPNPSKTNVSAFHLRNKQANRKLIVKWEDVELTHCSTPTYLGVTLDRALTYKTHCEKTSKKINTRNGLIRKLTGSAWGAQPHALRVSAMALCYSVGEYACPVWRSSTHAKKIDIALNTTCRLITGCLRNTPMDKVYLLAGIPPPSVRRLISSKIERGKQKRDTRHPMYGQNDPTSRLKSRKSFLKITEELTETPLLSRLNEWKKLITDTNSKRWLEPAERLPHGNNLDWPVWKTLDRLRVGVGRTKENMRKWGYGEQDITCICGQDQTTSHLLVCPRGSSPCTQEDLMIGNKKAINTAIYWTKEKI